MNTLNKIFPFSGRGWVSDLHPYPVKFYKVEKSPNSWEGQSPPWAVTLEDDDDDDDDGVIQVTKH